MHEIVVLSGKGGTGKTSLTASLAVLAGNDAVIADCDVDAANMHLLLRPDFGETFEFYSGELAVINQDLCNQCGTCAEVCRFHAIPQDKNQYQINALDCEGCGYCEKVCPTHAITMQERRSGSVYISKTKVGSTMVHARLDIAAENSGKLVAKVKNDAKAIALAGNKHFIIVDGSPGIGCPVVSSLAGANYVILVTEPTMSGLHDLKRVHAVIERFRIKSGCIINKYDLNKEQTAEIKCFLREEQIDHLADIPYDSIFSEAMIEEKTIVEIESPLKQLVGSIWEKVKEQLTRKN
ncbi:MAG: (4Fe-4S)-binding protein [Bacteroidetes bacterium]|nr:MAG: (4Fe-4S)-binding protein [Bacteroidota bacterium]